jgi:small subunit ribosomal protein S1
MEDFMAALDERNDSFQVGQTVKGKPFQHEPDGVYIDIGGKSSAFLPGREAAVGVVDDLAERLPLGVEREFLIIRGQDANGQVTVSIRELELKQVWARLQTLADERQTLPVRVTGTNRGGVTVDALGLRGFIPRSHLLQREDLDVLVGQTLNVVVLELKPKDKRIVLSHREAAKLSLMASVRAGELVTGRVSGIRPFGVFVDLNGISALLHIKQVSQSYVASLQDLFEVGQEVTAVVLEVDDWKGRIALSTAVLENYRGEMLEQPITVQAEARDRYTQRYPDVSESPESTAPESTAPESTAPESEPAEAVVAQDAVDSDAATAAAIAEPAIAPSATAEQETAESNTAEPGQTPAPATDPAKSPTTPPPAAPDAPASPPADPPKPKVINLAAKPMRPQPPSSES